MSQGSVAAARRSPRAAPAIAAAHPASSRPAVKLGERDGVATLEVPRAADTGYLAHGYFRYIGKYPPQLVAWLLERHRPRGPLVDPMCGGGTTLIEARLRGLDAVGLDVNPLARLVSTAVSRPVDPDRLDAAAGALLAALPRAAARPLRLRYCAEYFSQATRRDLAAYLELARAVDAGLRGHLLVALHAVLRRISRANIKKMNLELDDDKRTVASLAVAVGERLAAICAANREYARFARGGAVRVVEADAAETGLPDGSVGVVFLHPPYLTNTAFSEFSQLQLALMDIDHRSIWRRELRCRGSFLHEPNGLKKYLVGWARILAEARRVLRPGGLLVSVVGDGQIDHVRIPVGAITRELAADLGLRHRESFVHLLHNHTGQTQSRKMKGQHVAVFDRP